MKFYFCIIEFFIFSSTFSSDISMILGTSSDLAQKEGSICSQIKFIVSSFQGAQQENLKKITGEIQEEKKLIFDTLLNGIDFMGTSFQSIKAFLPEDKVQTLSDVIMHEFKELTDSCLDASYERVVMIFGNKMNSSDSTTLWGRTKYVIEQLSRQSKILIEERILSCLSEEELEKFSPVEKQILRQEREKVSSIIDFFCKSAVNRESFEGYYKFPFKKIGQVLSRFDPRQVASLEVQSLLQRSESFLHQLFIMPILDLLGDDGVSYLLKSSWSSLIQTISSLELLDQILDQIKDILSLPNFFLSTDSYIQLTNTIGDPYDTDRAKKTRSLWAAANYLNERVQEGDRSIRICQDIIGQIEDNDDTNKTLFYLLFSLLKITAPAYGEFELNSHSDYSNRIFQSLKRLQSEYPNLDYVKDSNQGWFKDAQEVLDHLQNEIFDSNYASFQKINALQKLRQNLIDFEESSDIEAFIENVTTLFDILLDRDPCPSCHAFCKFLIDLEPKIQSLNQLLQKTLQKNVLIVKGLPFIQTFILDLFQILKDLYQSKKPFCSMSLQSLKEATSKLYNQLVLLDQDEIFQEIETWKVHNAGCTSVEGFIIKIGQTLQSCIDQLTLTDTNLLDIDKLEDFIEATKKLRDLTYTPLPSCLTCQNLSFQPFSESLDQFLTLLQKAHYILTEEYKDKLIYNWNLFVPILRTIKWNFPAYWTLKQSQSFLDYGAEPMKQTISLLQSILDCIDSADMKDANLREVDLRCYVLMRDLLKDWTENVCPYITSYDEKLIHDGHSSIAFFEEFLESANQLAVQFESTLCDEDLYISSQNIQNFSDFSVLIEKFRKAINEVPNFLNLDLSEFENQSRALSETFKRIVEKLQKDCPNYLKKLYKDYAKNLRALALFMKKNGPWLDVVALNEIKSKIATEVNAERTQQEGNCLHHQTEAQLTSLNQILRDIVSETEIQDEFLQWADIETSVNQSLASISACLNDWTKQPLMCDECLFPLSQSLKEFINLLQTLPPLSLSCQYNNIPKLQSNDVMPALISWQQYLENQTLCSDKLTPVLSCLADEGLKIFYDFKALSLDELKERAWQNQVLDSLNLGNQKLQEGISSLPETFCISQLRPFLESLTYFEEGDDKLMSQNEAFDTVQNVLWDLNQTITLMPVSLSGDHPKDENFVIFLFSVCRCLDTLVSSVRELSHLLTNATCTHVDVSRFAENIAHSLDLLQVTLKNKAFRLLEDLFFAQCEEYEKEAIKNLILDEQGLTSWWKKTAFHANHLEKLLNRLAEEFRPELQINPKICAGIRPNL